MADELRLAFTFFPDGEVVPPDGPGERSIRLRAVYYPNGIARKTGTAPALDTSTSRFDGLRKGSEQDHGPERGEPSGWFRAFAPRSEALNLSGQSISPVGFANQAMTDSYSDTPQGAPGGTTSYREAIDPVSAAPADTYEVSGFTVTPDGKLFAGPGASSSQNDALIAPTQEQIMKAARNVMDKINSGELRIITSNRAVAGIEMYVMFA